MRAKWVLALIGLCGLSLPAQDTYLQNSSVAYQGRLVDAGKPAEGIYDFRFVLWDSASGGNELGLPLTNNSLAVASGLFTAILNLDDNLFSGDSRWLEIGVRTNGSSGVFQILLPRQSITATPYAKFSGRSGMASNLAGGGCQLTNVPASCLTGTLPLTKLSGITPAQIDPVAWQLATNGPTPAQLAGATNLIAAGFSLSVNAGNLPHFQKALNSDRPPRVLWLGDSIGLNTMEAFLRTFEAYWPPGVQRGAFSTGFPRYFTTQTGPWAWESVPGIWRPVFILTNTATQTWGGTDGGGYVYADTLQLWYMRDPNSGSALLEVATNGSTWQSVAVVSGGTGTGLAVTNFTLTPGSDSVRLTSLGGGPANRFCYLWACLLDSKSRGLVASGFNAGGQDLSAFLAMGTNNVATLLSNLNPDLIFYEQKKDVWTRSNWPTAAGLLRAYATNADVCLLSGQISNGPNDYPPNPTNSSYAIALVDRSIALSNGWAYVDDFNPLNDWPNIIVANGFNADGIVHLNAAGQLFAGSIAVKQLGLVEMLTTARPDGAARPGWSSGSGSPEGRVIATPGSIYSRTDGGPGATLYVKESGSGATGWRAK